MTLNTLSNGLKLRDSLAKEKIACITSDTEMYDISFDRSIDCLGPIMTLNKWRVISNFNGEIDRAVRENKYYMFYTVNKRWPDKRDVITV